MSLSKEHTYREAWEQEFVWLRFERGIGMKCEICIATRKQNIFVKGCKDDQKSSLVRHASSDQHKQAVEAKKMARHFKTSLKKAENVSEDQLLPQIRTVHQMVVENLPVIKFEPLMQLQVENGLESCRRHYKSHVQV